MDELLKSLLEIQSPSGEEAGMKRFILDYVERNAPNWKTTPEVIAEDALVQDCLILVFGDPRVAAFAHMDTTGFSVRYQDQLIPIGSPEVVGGEVLIGADGMGSIECELILDKNTNARYKFGRGIASGTSLVYKGDVRQEGTHIVSPYLDNRVGIYNLLRLAERIEHGALVFSCWEEHGGGSVPYLVRYLFDRFGTGRMLVSDVTWVTDGIALDEGVVISYRDRNIPRKDFVHVVESILEKENIPFQIEVEAYGSSDGREIQQSPYPIDWCFVGPPVENAHSNAEKLSRTDVESMISAYQCLFENL